MEMKVSVIKTERTNCMKKFKKVVAMCLTAVMALSMMSVGAFASGDVTKAAETMAVMQGILL